MNLRKNKQEVSQKKEKRKEVILKKEEIIKRNKNRVDPKINNIIKRNKKEVYQILKVNKKINIEVFLQQKVNRPRKIELP